MHEPSTWGRPNQRHLRASSIHPALVTMHTQAQSENINFEDNCKTLFTHKVCPRNHKLDGKHGTGRLGWSVVTLVPTL